MSEPDLRHLLPPPLPEARKVPWSPLLALLVPAAALAAGTGLQRLEGGPSGEAVLHWLWWSSGAGLLLGGLAGLLRRQRLFWPVYGLAAPWLLAAGVSGAVQLARPVREALADRREASCRREGRAVCTLREFTARCAAARADPAQAATLLGEPRSASCAGKACTLKWLYTGPFRPEEYNGPGAEACFVLTDAQGRGVRHWLMATEPP